MIEITEVEKKIDEINLYLKDISRSNSSFEEKVKAANDKWAELDYIAKDLTYSQSVSPVLSNKLSDSFRMCYSLTSNEKPAERT